MNEGGTWVYIREFGPFIPCKIKLYLYAMQANYHLVEGFKRGVQMFCMPFKLIKILKYHGFKFLVNYHFVGGN
jgi:hypothetical protein